jgi:ABC-type transport system involved in cytochrome c biogenesis permease subunit
MKRHRFGLFWERLPSLELLDDFSRRSLVAGVVFLTLTILVGHAVRRAVPEGGGYWVVEIVGTNLLWLVGAVVVAARRFGGIRPAAAASASVALFVLAMGNLVAIGMLSSAHKGL